MPANYSWQRQVCNFDNQGNCSSPQIVGPLTPQAAYLTDLALNLPFTETIGPTDYLVGANIIEVKLRRITGFSGDPPFVAPPVPVYRRVIEKNSSGQHTLYIYERYFEGEPPSTTLDSDPANQPNPRSLSGSLVGAIQIAVDQFFPNIGTEINHPGLYQWEETHVHNGNLISSRVLETFEMQSVGIRNFRANKLIVNPESNEPTVVISGDIVTYPHVDLQNTGNWTPPSDMNVRLKFTSPFWDPGDEIEFSIINITPFTAGDDGKVGDFSYVWDGKTNLNAIKEGLVQVEAQVLVPIQGGGDTVSLPVYTGVEVSRCKCAKKCLSGSALFSMPISVHQPKFGGLLGSILDYDSGQCGAIPTSLGYGWTSVETNRIYDSGGTTIQLRTSSGDFLSWNETSPGIWEPVYEDNKMTLEVFPSTPAEKYVVTSRAQSKMIFDDSGDYVKYEDRNGNVTTYSRGNNGTNDYFLSSDGLGREVYHHKTATHNQPTVINDNIDPALGRRYELTYDTDNRLASVTDPEGEVVEFYYNGDGRIAEILEKRPVEGDRSTIYTYYGPGPFLGRLRCETTYPFVDGGVLRAQQQKFYFYNVLFNGEINTKVIFFDVQNESADIDFFLPPPRNPDRIRCVSFDTLGRKIAEYELFEYGGNPSLDQYLETRYEYTDSNDPYLVTKMTAPNGSETSYFYTPRGNLKRVRDAQLNETVMTYVEEDTNHPAYATFPDLLLEVRRPAPDLDNQPTVFYAPTRYEYEPLTGNLLSIEDAKQNKVHFTYNGRGQVLTVTDRRWDGASGTKSDHTTVMNYYPDGNLEYIETPEDVGLNPAKRVTFHYDDFDNVEKIVDGLGNQVVMVHDALDRMTSVTDPHLSTNLSPDTTTYFFDENLLKSITSPQNNGSSGPRLTVMGYDLSGRLRAVDRQVSSSSFDTRVQYEIDGFSQITSLIRYQNGNPRQDDFFYDRQGRMIATYDPLYELTLMGYEPYCVGNATTSARGVRRKISFDNLCRLTMAESGTPDSGGLLALDMVRETRSFSYDDLSRMTSSVQNLDARYQSTVLGIDKYVENDTRTYTYDELDRLLTMTFEDGRTVDYEWDEESNLTKMTDPEGKVTEFTYFNDNSLRRIVLKRSGQPDRIFEYRYDEAGRPLTVTYPAEADLICKFDDGTNTPGSGWDPKGQLIHLRYERVSDQSVVRKIQYGYDPAGNREFMLDVSDGSAVKWEYEFDWLDRLVKVKRASDTLESNLPTSPLGASFLERSYEFDSSDNRVFYDDHVNGHTYQYIYTNYTSGTTTYASDNLEEIRRASGAGERNPVNFSTFETLDYDLDGNLIKRTLSGGEEIDYSWSDWDRLLGVESNQSGRMQDNRYDVSGLRKRKLDKTGNNSLEYDVGISTSVSRPGTNASNAPVLSYFSGPNGILGYEEGDGNFRYFIMDILNSVRDVLDNNGAVIWSQEFTEYGDLITSGGTGVAPAKSWIGGLSVNDDTNDSGLYLMGHRHYQSNPVGRFISRDPIGFAGGLALYGYPTDPVNAVDPSGLSLFVYGNAAQAHFLEYMLEYATGFELEFGSDRKLRITGSTGCGTPNARRLLKRLIQDEKVVTKVRAVWNARTNNFGKYYTRDGVQSIDLRNINRAIRANKGAGLGLLFHELGEAYSRCKFGTSTTYKEQKDGYQRDHFGLANEFENDLVSDYRLEKQFQEYIYRDLRTGERFYLKPVYFERGGLASFDWVPAE